MFRMIRPAIGPRLVLSVLAMSLATLAGCGHPTRIVLHQPFAPPTQQTLHLDADQAYYSCSCGQQAAAITFPLPGAHDGPRAFVLYLLAPDQAGSLPVNPTSPDGVRGFLIQEVGALAGRSDLLEGAVTVKGDWLSKSVRTIELDVRCEDGTRIAGKAVLQSNPPEVRAFEEEFSADVRLVAQPASPLAGQRTRPRESTTQ